MTAARRDVMQEAMAEMPLPAVNWAMQFPDTREPRSSAITAQFLNAFGRGDRDQNFRNAGGSPLQALTMMNHPFVTSRIKEPNQLFGVRIQAGDIGPFVKVAAATAKSKVFNRCSTAMLRGDDVIYDMLEGGGSLGHAAVLAHAASSPSNLLFQCLVHRGLRRGPF